MFKLIVIPLDDGTYKVITLDAYYAEGTRYDITKYVDLKEWDVNRGKIFSEISFKFQEPTTKGNIIYEQINGRAFGDEEHILREDPNDSTSEQLEGESFTLELPFEQVIFERLYSVSNGEPSNIVYGAITDEDNEPVNPKPVIFYNHNRHTNSNIIGFRNDINIKVSLSKYNNPLHGNGTDNPLYSTTFSAELNIWNFTRLTNNLYTNHYSNYIEDTFNIRKREFMHKAFLPLRIITKLELNDLLIIKGSLFRITKYSYNIITGEATFELINFFGAVAPGQLRASEQTINTDYRAAVVTLYVSNLGSSFTITNVEIAGGGTGWASVVEDPLTEQGILTVSIDENTGADRSMFFDITSDGVTERVLIRQGARVLTVDSTIITVDSTLITVDNNYLSL